MAALTNSNPNLYDLASLPDFADAKDVIELLAQQNPILEDAPAFECNDGSSHKTTVRTGLPSVTWFALYQGIPSSKGSRQQVKDTCGMMESAAEVDARLIDELQDADDKADMRADEANGHIEALAQEAATAIVYHNTATDPKKPMGLSPRFNSFSAENGSQLVEGGGTGNDNTSIWMITWERSACHLIYPKGTKAGISREDLGKIPATDSNGHRYMVYREEFRWHLGLTVRNWQYVARVCNIDVSELTEDAATGADIINLMTEMYYKHAGRRVPKGKTCIYANTTIVKFLDYQSRLAQNKNLFLTWGEYGPNAKEVLMFRGVPIRECDCILNTEARVV